MDKGKEDVACHRLILARDALESARLLLDAGQSRAGVNRLYYACFYAATSLLILENWESKKHTGVRSAFNDHYVRTGRIPPGYGRLYNRLFEARHEADYVDFSTFDAPSLRVWLDQTREFIEICAVEGRKVAEAE